MNEKMRNEIQATLNDMNKQLNLFGDSVYSKMSNDPKIEGWVEALEYVLSLIETQEGGLNE
jgi:hypothetical protein|tara:strand:+ start:813 stop:995 length:183 start_codon:yes stop_codon:yes gene_type:complete